MTTTVNTRNSSTPITNNLLDDQKIFPILEEATTKRTSDVALRTLQQSPSELSKELKELRKQFSTAVNQLSLKLSLILQNQDRLSKELEELRKQPIISLCPPPPPPPPSSKISLSLQTTTTLTSEMQSTQPTENLRQSQSLRIKTSKEPIATEQQIADGLKNLRKSKNGNETSPTPQNDTTHTLETNPTPQNGTNLHRSQSLHVKRNNNKQENETSEVKESTTFAERLAQFKNLSQKSN